MKLYMITFRRAETCGKAETFWSWRVHGRSLCGTWGTRGAGASFGVCRGLQRMKVARELAGSIMAGRRLVA